MTSVSLAEIKHQTITILLTTNKIKQDQTRLTQIGFDLKNAFWKMFVSTKELEERVFRKASGDYPKYENY